MIIHPELRALRDDDAPQRNAQEARIAVWRNQPAVVELIDAVMAFASGGEIADHPALTRMFGKQDDAAERLARELTSVVAADFSPSEVWERVLAGTATAAVIDRGATGPDRADLIVSEMTLRPGSLIVRDARFRHVRLDRVQGCLVSLRLQRRMPGAGPTREYALTDGALVHQAAGNPKDSRTELMMALLGRMGRADAAPAMAGIATEEGSGALRWQALRECLSLDTAQGFSALCEVARRADDELAPAAGALRSQLIEAYPQLRELA